MAVCCAGTEQDRHASDERYSNSQPTHRRGDSSRHCILSAIAANQRKAAINYF